MVDPSTKKVSSSIDSSYRYVVAYGVVFLLFFAISRTKLGYAFIYYSLVLALLFVCVTEAPFIVSLVAPITNPNSVQTIVK